MHERTCGAVGIIVIGIIVILIIVFVIGNEKEKQKAHRKAEAQARAQAQKEREAFQLIQEEVLKIPNTEFYNRLLHSLKTQIQKDVKAYLTNTYNEYMKTPSADSAKFKPFDDETCLGLAAGDIIIRVKEIYYYQAHCIILSCRPEWRSEMNIEFSKNGYSNLTPIQMWALARTLSKDLGYQLTQCCHDGNDDWRISDTPHDAAIYRKITEERPNRNLELRIEAINQTGFIGQLINSEIQCLRSSGVSYRAPF